MSRSPELFLPDETTTNKTTITHKYGQNERGSAVLTITAPLEAPTPTVSRSITTSDELWVSADKDSSLTIRGHKDKPTAVFVASDIANIDVHRSQVATEGSVDSVQTFFNARAVVAKDVTSTAEAGDGTTIIVGGEVHIAVKSEGSQGRIFAKQGKRFTEDKSGR